METGNWKVQKAESRKAKAKKRAEGGDEAEVGRDRHETLSPFLRAVYDQFHFLALLLFLLFLYDQWIITRREHIQIFGIDCYVYIIRENDMVRCTRCIM